MKENSLKKSVFKKISVLTREVFFNYLVLLVKNCMPNKVSISVALGNATKHCLYYILPPVTLINKINHFSNSLNIWCRPKYTSIIS
jgi:hypothetical protein